MSKRLISFLLLFLFTCSIANASGDVINLNYEVDRDDKGVLSVKLKLKGNSSGITDLYIPLLGGVNEDELTIKSIHNSHELKQKKMRSEKCSDSYPYYCNVIRAKHHPNEPIELYYNAENTYFPVFASKETVLFQGRSLIYPKPENKKYIMSLSCDGFNLKNAYVIDSNNLIELDKEILSYPKFSDVYIFSHSNISSHELEGDDDIRYVTIGFEKNKKDSTKEKELVNLASNIFSNNKRFIKGVLGGLNRDKKESIILLKTSEEISNWRGIKAPETAIIIIKEEYHIDDIAHTISHESMHDLFSNGYGVSVKFGPKMQFNHFWFDEGFTDYYADFLNYRNGIISKKSYIKILNLRLDRYYRMYKPNEFLFSKDGGNNLLESHEYFTAFYDIGRIIALDLNNIILSKTHNQSSLDDFIKILVAENCKKLPCNINKEQFIASLNKLTDTKFAEKYINNYIINSLHAVPPKILHTPKATLFYKTIQDYNLGFDLVKSFYTGLVYNIDQNSNAFKSGIRENMKIVEYQYENGVVSLNIETEDKKQKTISFEPKGPMLLPYYK